MKDQFLDIPLKKNEEKSRFELEVNGHIAFIDYKETNSTIALIHTEAPAELGGTGAASALVEKTLNFIKDAGKSISPYCPYVFAYIKKHPEWKEHVSPRFPKYDEI
ncbi:GNAT family N-acetyltransferase [Sphingobacterium lactis]|uniref:N-acetyltransferase domain-containing protein n=1 Tax=Sphingobacterium lactis TaxID=797291 RepID=A0A1H6BUU5_9SPHI|nr:GNAT family N-acetyltransferase [Sphingobacterium lactis]SEG63996.1 hypothetical protein SAMN05421877_111130 [Sphingobacterium lactis]